MTNSGLDLVRSMAVTATIPSCPVPLRVALKNLGFVQADPIRSPARAQDLILRHRAKDYKAGDLERLYHRLPVEEDVLYVYGFLTQENYQLLHPRYDAEEPLDDAEQLVLELARKSGRLHPRDLEPHFGAQRSVNAWGGFSKASTQMLEELHYRGHLRISRREKGIRLYTVASRPVQQLDTEQRLRSLTMLLAGLLAPVPETSLKRVVNTLRYAAPLLRGRNSIVTRLLASGELESSMIDGVRYLYPAACPARQPDEVVRLLAPFDPVVWDRVRFEHLWGWRYRFEAYTPPEKRVYGYYALPLLWIDKVVGWANASIDERGKLYVETGFVDKSVKRDSLFRAALKEEIERFREFLGS